MHPVTRRSLGFAVLGIGTALALVGCTAAPTPAPPATRLPVVVDGVARWVAPGTTLGDAAHTFALEPRPGRLLSVSGRVLDPAARPGALLLNGIGAPDTTELTAGDVLVAQDGPDRVEGTRRVTSVLSREQPGNPQYSLATRRTREVDLVGRSSGEIVSTRYHPMGALDVPRAVALTFDDGPWPSSTRAILQVLRRHHVRATFFMIGRNVRRWPAIARDVVRAGMVVGNHSWDHPGRPMFEKLGPHRLQTELAHTSRALRDIGVTDPYLFRPPGGSWDPGVIREAARQGLRVVNWNVDPEDWRAGRSAKQVVHAVLSHVGPGSIVDLHDGGGNQRATIRALRTIIKRIRGMGLRLVAIPR
jgi:peptidoglycan/xylan/chitin deacetylase (PgdA/CDA1 family)